MVRGEEMAQRPMSEAPLTTETSAAARRKRVKRMKAIFARYLRYVSTYMDGDYNADCQDKTFVLDMIYGLGISIDEPRFRCADGFDRFKAELREHIKMQERS